MNTKIYLQSTDEIEIMEAGIIEKNFEFADGENHEFTYDFNNKQYATLKSKYNMKSMQKKGRSLKKRCAL